MKKLSGFFYGSKNNKPNILFILVIICSVLLCIIGCVMVYSASSYSALKNYGDPAFFLKKQIIGCVLGLIAMCFFYFFDYTKLKKFKWVILAVAIVGLILVFIPGIGMENYGAKRWVHFLGISFQPSELAKFALVLFCASYFSQNYKKVKMLKTLIPAVIVGGILCLLVILEPNMSVTMCLGLTLIVMLVVGGMKKRYLGFVGLAGAIGVPALIIAEPYRMKRLVAFVDPWANPKGEGFQLIQSLYALGNGGLFGVGLFNSRQKYLFLPFSESDFIFSIIGEELGLFGAIFVIAVFLTLIICISKIALNAKDRFGCLLATGIASVIAIQVAINIAVVTGSVPPTGLPLPFISAGSTSLVVFMSVIGVVLNVNKQSKNRV